MTCPVASELLPFEAGAERQDPLVAAVLLASRIRQTTPGPRRGTLFSAEWFFS